MQCQLILAEQPGLDHDLILLDEAAHGIDVDDVFESFHNWANDPIHERPPLHQFFKRHLVPWFLIARPLQIELIDLAQPGRIRHQL